MPRYFFDIKDGSRVEREAYDLADLATARCEAVTLAGRLICNAASTFWDSREFSMTVSNIEGLMLFTLHFIGTEAAAIRTGHPSSPIATG